MLTYAILITVEVTSEEKRFQLIKYQGIFSQDWRHLKKQSSPKHIVEVFETSNIALF
jgi:hypothetical protein